MTLTAIEFVLTSLESGRLLGRAVVAIDARYASVAWHGAGRLERLHPSPTDWKAIEQDVRLGLNPGPLAAGLTLARLLAGARGAAVVVQWLTSGPIEIGSHGQAVAALDARLQRGEGDGPAAR